MNGLWPVWQILSGESYRETSAYLRSLAGIWINRRKSRENERKKEREEKREFLGRNLGDEKKKEKWNGLTPPATPPRPTLALRLNQTLSLSL